MSISSTTRKAGPYTGNGVTTALPFSFKVFTSADVRVVRTDLAGVESDLTLTTDYTVILNADQDSNPGGTVTLVTAAASGFLTTITSEVDDLQPLVLTNTGGFYPSVINTALDRLTIMVQQLAEKVARALQYSISSPLGDSALPTPVANNIIGWNSDANGFQNYPPSDNTLLSAALSASSGASLVGYLPAGTGAVATTVQSKLRESLSVKDFGAVGDGVTDDQAEVAAAVAAAYSAGDWLYWPDGTYLTTASIPNFHGVKHFGPGVVKRGTDLFYVDPAYSVTNTIYLATTGSSVNDGLSASQPLATFQNAFDALKNYGPVLDGTWQIIGAAGTYTISAGSHNHTTPSKNRVVIKGPAAGHPNVPTLLIDGGGNQADYMHGLNTDGIGVRAQVQDIKFQNFTEASGNTRLGLVAANGADLYTVNVHGFACSWAAIDAKECEQVRISGGIIDGNSVGAYGIISDSSHTSLGYGSASTADGPVIKNALSAGVYWSTGSQGHMDYCKLEDNAVAFLCSENSRCDTVGNNFKRNTVAIRAQSGGVFGEGGAVNVFNDGTADANTSNIQCYAGSLAYTEMHATAREELRIAQNRTPGTHTGVTGDTNFLTLVTLPIGFFTDNQQKVRIKLYGVVTSATTAPAMHLACAGVNSSAISFPANANAGTAFEAEFELFSNGTGNHRVTQKIGSSLVAPRMSTQALTFNFTSGAQNIDLFCNLTTAGDSLAFNRIEVFAMG